MSIIELNCWFLLNKIECFIELGINLLPTTYTDHTLKFIIITYPMITYKSVLELYSWTDRAFGTAGLLCFGIHFIFSTTSMYVRKLQHVLSAIKKSQDTLIFLYLSMLKRIQHNCITFLTLK